MHVLKGRANLNEPAQDVLLVQVLSLLRLLFQSLIQVTGCAVVRDDAHVRSVLERVLAAENKWVGELLEYLRLEVSRLFFLLGSILDVYSLQYELGVVPSLVLVPRHQISVAVGPGPDLALD